MPDCCPHPPVLTPGDKLAAVHPGVRRRIGLEAHLPYILDSRNVGGPHAVEQHHIDMRLYREVVPRTPETVPCSWTPWSTLDRPAAEALMADVMADFRNGPCRPFDDVPVPDATAQTAARPASWNLSFPVAPGPRGGQNADGGPPRR